MRNITTTKLFAIYLCLNLCTVFLGNLRVQAQTCTSQNSPSTYNPGFPRNANVQVYIDPNITGARRTSIQTAISNWQPVTGPAGLTFTYVTTAPTNPPAAGVYSWLIGEGQTVGTPNARGESGTFFDSTGHVQQAVTVIDPRVTNAAAVLDVMSHEVGHPLGLDDCLSCSATDSIMSPGNTRSDYWNGLSGRPTSPTPCDVQKVNANYPTPTPTPTPTPGGGGCFAAEGCDCPCGDCINGCEPPEPTCDWYYPDLECSTVCEIDDYGYPYNCETECYQPPPVYICY